MEVDKHKQEHKWGGKKRLQTTYNSINFGALQRSMGYGKSLLVAQEVRSDFHGKAGDMALNCTA